LVLCCPGCGRDKLEVNSITFVYHCFRCNISGKLVFNKKPNGPVITKAVRDDSKAINIPGYPYMWTAISLFSCLERGIDPSRIVNLRIATSSDKMFKNRIIIPIIEDGITKCYAARAIYDWMPLKEMFPPSIVSNKSHYLYNIDDLYKGDTVVLTEGIYDCEAVVNSGYKCVASLGSDLSDIQAGKLLCKRPDKIVIFYDFDDPGRKGGIEAMKKLRKRTDIPIQIIDPGIQMQLEVFPKDPGEMKSDVIRQFLKRS